MEMEPSRINVDYYSRKGNYYLQEDGLSSLEKGNSYLHEKLVSRRKVTTTHREGGTFHRRKVILPI